VSKCFPHSTYIIVHEIRMCVIDSIVHNCCCDIFARVTKCPSFFDVQIKSRFATGLANIFLYREKKKKINHRIDSYRRTYQIPLILKKWILWRFITTFDADMWNLMNSSFDLKFTFSYDNNKKQKICPTSSCR